MSHELHSSFKPNATFMHFYAFPAYIDKMTILHVCTIKIKLIYLGVFILIVMDSSTQQNILTCTVC